MREKTSFWTSLKGLFAPAKASKRGVSYGVGNTPLSALNAGIDFGVPVDNNTAMKVTAFYAGIRIISENIASLPRSVRRRDPAGMLEVSSTPAATPELMAFCTSVGSADRNRSVLNAVR